MQGGAPPHSFLATELRPAALLTVLHQSASYPTPQPTPSNGPDTQGTILPGVTRRSIIELARSRGYTVEEEPVSVTEAMEADEVCAVVLLCMLCLVCAWATPWRRSLCP